MSMTKDATRIGSAGVVRRLAVDISPLLRVNQAIYLLITCAPEAAFRDIKTIAEYLLMLPNVHQTTMLSRKRMRHGKSFLTKTKTKTTLTNLTIIFSCITFAASQHQPCAIILSIVHVFQKGQILLDR
ncbi:hypothetical protein RYX36_036691, partial [Vicia faba]